MQIGGQKQVKVIFCLLAAVVIIFVLYKTRRFAISCEYSRPMSSLDTSAEVAALALRIQRLVAKAHRLSRSPRVNLLLKEAFSDLQGLVHEVDHQKLSSTENSFRPSPSVSSVSLPDVCPEDTTRLVDYPWYMDGHFVQRCRSKPWHEVVTMLISTDNCAAARSVQAGILRNYSLHHSHISYSSVPFKIFNFGDEDCQEKNITNFNRDKFTGSKIKSIIRNLKSKFVLIGMGMTHFDFSARLERLVRMMNELAAGAVGGATRMVSNGHWTTGCHQMGMKNYTLKMVYGYDVSYKSCQLCDHLSGPFLASKEHLLTLLDDRLHGDVLFLDFFLKLSRHKFVSRAHSGGGQSGGVGGSVVLSCADVMYHVTSNELSYHLRDKSMRAELKSFAKNWQLNVIIPPDLGTPLRFSCADIGAKCGLVQGQLLPVCCAEQLAEIIKVSLCTNNCTAAVEAESGTAIELIKGGCLQWDVDGDITVRNTCWDKVKSEISARKDFSQSWNKDKSFAAIRTKDQSQSMFLEIWAFGSVSNENYLRAAQLPNLTQTRIYFDGVWLPVPTNPGLYSRNRYGDNIFAHVEHWRALKAKSSWANYSVTTGHFSRCRKPGFHSCYDGQYLPDGNLQFFDIYL